MGKAIEEKLESVLKKPFFCQASISEQFQKLNQAIAGSCAIHLQPPKQKHLYWFDDNNKNIQKMLTKRRKCFYAYLNNKSAFYKIKHKSIQLEVRQMLRIMENTWWEKQSSEMEHFSAKGNSHAKGWIPHQISWVESSESSRTLF